MFRRRPPILILLAILLVGLAPPALSDVIRLRNGDAVKGRPIQERSNENQLVVEDYLSGGLRRFNWAALDPADRDQLWERWGWKNTDQGIVPGHRVVVRLDDGSTEEILGLVEEEGEREVRIRRGGRVDGIPRQRVVAIEEEPLDARQIWSAEQLVERLKEKMKQDGTDFAALTSRDRWRIASYAEWAGDLEAAKEHYEAAAADESYLKRDVAKQRLERVVALLQDKAALATLKAARLKLQMHRFDDVRGIINTFAEKHPDASEEVGRRLDRVRSKLAEERTSYFRTIARRNFVKIAEDLIESKVREKDIEYTDVTSWTRKDLIDAAFAKLVDKHMKRYDPTVTPEEARTLWDGRMEGRTKPRWRKASYGGGTFIVSPPKIKPPKRKSGARKRSGGGGAGPIDIPKPPNRDGWWKKADFRERTQYVLAYFAERSELFEMGEPEYRQCMRCNGVGLESKSTQTGAVFSYLCPRCGGAQRDMIVKFR